MGHPQDASGDRPLGERCCSRGRKTFVNGQALHKPIAKTAALSRLSLPVDHHPSLFCLLHVFSPGPRARPRCGSSPCQTLSASKGHQLPPSVLNLKRRFPLQRMGPPRELPRFRWDYRWMDFPGQGYAIKHPGDISLRSFYGHQVLQTLIRSYFSPAQTTGQRYIYTGSSCGAVHIYDILSGEQVMSFVASPLVCHTATDVDSEGCL